MLYLHYSVIFPDYLSLQMSANILYCICLFVGWVILPVFEDFSKNFQKVVYLFPFHSYKDMKEQKGRDEI